jgi:CBS domain-containing protein
MDATAGSVCVRDVVTVNAAASIADAAALMREHHIGAVVITEGSNGAAVPIGILTDRDIVVETVALKLDPATVKVGEIVQRRLATVTSDASCSHVVREMAINGVRRLPVVNADGTLSGIVSLDDVLIQLVTPLVAVGDLAARERRFEAATRST